MVRFEYVGMRYGAGPEVLRDICFTIESGSFHFVVGPSGAGKSSLLKILYLGHRPSRGLLTMFGRDIATLRRDEMPALRRRIGIVFQDFRLLGYLSAYDNVALPLRIAGAREDQIRDHVCELLKWVGLGDHIDAPPAILSGGQKQRVAIARAVITRPELLLADEPTGNVDPDVGARLLRLFEELNKIGTTVLIATHNESLASRYDHPVVFLDGGTLAAAPQSQLRAI